MLDELAGLFNFRKWLDAPSLALKTFRQFKHPNIGFTQTILTKTMGFKPILRTVAEEKSLLVFRAIFLDAKQIKNGSLKFLVNLKSAFNEAATLRTFFFKKT